jgi:hypothetical protein
MKQGTVKNPFKKAVEGDWASRAMPKPRGSKQIRNPGRDKARALGIPLPEPKHQRVSKGRPIKRQST